MPENLVTKKESNNYSISIYKDELTLIAVAEEQFKIKSAFPGLPKEFFELLTNRIKENGFTDKRLRDAVNNLVDNFVYPTPTIANIISFDKRVKLYTYNQLVDHINNNGVWDDYLPVKKIGKKTLYASIQDVDMYKLETLK